MYKDWREYREAYLTHVGKLVDDGIIPESMRAGDDPSENTELTDRIGEGLLRRGIPVEMHPPILLALGKGIGMKMAERGVRLDDLEEIEAVKLVMVEIFKALGLEDTPAAMRKDADETLEEFHRSIERGEFLGL